MKNDCRKIRKEIAPYHLGEGSAACRAAVEEHLLHCPGCRELSRAMAGAFAAVARCGRPAPVQMWPRVRALIERRSRVHYMGRPEFSIASRLLLAPMLNLIVTGALISRIAAGPPVQFTVIEWDVIQNMEFLNDFEVCRELDLLRRIKK